MEGEDQIPMSEKKGYRYYNNSVRTGLTPFRRLDEFVILGSERLIPSLQDPDFLVLKARKRLFSGWLNDLQAERLRVLDVGGRIQPYRKLVEHRIDSYIAIDPILEGLVDVVASGEHLPFPNESFDLVICSQVLSYVTNPFMVINEIQRVLKAGGILIVSVPSFFPRHHDERWRILPDGLRVLLSGFSTVEVAPEGYSIAGIFRTANVAMNNFFANHMAQRILRMTVIPIFNVAGILLDRLSFGNDQFTANISARARKSG
jgi:SAM-dependent methyltransferase